MAASVETKGKSVDEAIFNGLQQLGLGIDEVDIEILEEGTKGLFGFGKHAVVRLTERTAPPMLEEVPTLDMEPEPEALLHPEEPEHAEHLERASTRQDRRSRGRQKKQKPAPQPEPSAEPDTALAAVDEADMQDVPEPGILEEVDIESAREAVAFLTGLFDVMGVDAKVNVLDNTDPLNVRIKITGDDTSILIGRRGDTLDALQYLTGLVLNRDSEEYIRVMLDAEDYRKKREQTLERLAHRLANNVVRTGRPVRLEPMNPYERRILHSALQGHPRVETISEGVDPNRRVVIRRKRNPRDRRDKQ